MPHISMRLRFSAVAFLLFALLASGRPAASAPRAQFGRFATGDVLVSLNNGDVQWFTPDGELKDTINVKLEGEAGGLAFDPAKGELYVTNRVQGIIMVIDSNGQLSREFGPFFLNGGMTSIVFDRNGNVITGREVYLASSEEPGGVTIFDPSGEKWYDLYPEVEFQTSFPGVAFPTPFFIDLSVDQRTLFYTNAGRVIKRFDISGGFQLDDFAILPDSLDSDEPVEATTNLRLLHPGDGSGGLLVADYADIKRLDRFGEVIQFYDADFENFWQALALDPDGKSFWAASGDDVYKFDIESGAQLDNFTAGFESSVGGLTVVGEPIAAQPTNIPTVTPSRTPTNTATHTPTKTPRNTATSTDTPTNPPVQLTDVPSSPPSGCRFPYCIYIPTPIALVGIGLLILVTGVGALALIVRGVRSRSAKRDRLRSKPTRTRVQGHPDAGEQSIIPSSDLPSPQIRLKFEQGNADYAVEPDGD